MLKDIRRLLRSYRKNKDGFRAFLENRCSGISSKRIVMLKHELDKAQERVAELDHLLNKLYEDNVLGKIPDNRYVQMSNRFEDEQSKLKESVNEMSSELAKYKLTTDETEKFTSVIDKYTDIKELDDIIINEFIDKIFVHHKEDIDGKTFQQVEIYYKFVGNLNQTTRKAA